MVPQLSFLLLVRSQLHELTRSLYLHKILESKPLRQRKFKSARLLGAYDKPWTARRDPRMLWDKVFFIGLTIVGLGVGAYIIYTGWQSVENPSVSSPE